MNKMPSLIRILIVYGLSYIYYYIIPKPGVHIIQRYEGTGTSFNLEILCLYSAYLEVGGGAFETRWN